MKFILDENLPRRLAGMLNAYFEEHEVHHHLQVFDPGTSDDVWLDALSLDPHVVVTQDRKIRRERCTSEALQRANLTAFFLSKGLMDLGLHEKVWKMVRLWPDLVQQAEACTCQPHTFTVTDSLKLIKNGPTCPEGCKVRTSR